tara:strand:- start:223 stop:525 length:303 start_codon:yes stop_codon:yes gene_type:complete
MNPFQELSEPGNDATWQQHSYVSLIHSPGHVAVQNSIDGCMQSLKFAWNIQPLVQSSIDSAVSQYLALQYIESAVNGGCANIVALIIVNNNNNFFIFFYF